MNRFWKVSAIGGAFLALAIAGFWSYQYFFSPDSKEPLPPGVRIEFESVPNCGIIKHHREKRYTYDFFCEEEVFGRVTKTGDWHVEHFLSYEGGDELYGFYPDRSGEEDKYYWGPSILYKANTENRTLTQFLDLSNNDPGASPRPWGSPFFITDVSRDQEKVVYANYFAQNSLYVRDMVSGRAERFSLDPSLYDFGDATFSADDRQIAFAGLKRKPAVSGQPPEFLEAVLYILDLTAGEISFQEARSDPGMYVIHGWNDGRVDFEYLQEN